MQKKISEYVVDMAADRRRLKKMWEKEGILPEFLVFHGTTSDALPGINRYHAVLSPRDLQRIGLPVVQRPRGRYSDPLKRFEDLRDRVVSVTRDLSTAFRYTDKNEKGLLRDAKENMSVLMLTMRLLYRGMNPGWAATHQISTLRSLLSYLKRRKRVERKFPVIVAVHAPNAPELRYYDPHARAEKKEEMLIQIPAHMAYFFVPAKYIWIAKRMLPRYAHRVFPLELLEEIAWKE